jgi:hypothetical protein
MLVKKINIIELTKCQINMIDLMIPLLFSMAYLIKPLVVLMEIFLVCLFSLNEWHKTW